MLHFLCATYYSDFIRGLFRMFCAIAVSLDYGLLQCQRLWNSGLLFAESYGGVAQSFVELCSWLQVSLRAVNDMFMTASTFVFFYDLYNYIDFVFVSHLTVLNFVFDNSLAFPETKKFFSKMRTARLVELLFLHCRQYRLIRWFYVKDQNHLLYPFSCLLEFYSEIRYCCIVP